MAQPKPKAAPRHLVSTPPRRTQCPKCARAVLACYVNGSTTRLDPVHVNQRGEAMVLVSGGTTYAVSVLGHHHPARRRVAHIADGLPRHGYVHPEHRCGFDWSSPELIDARHLFAAPVNPSMPPPF